MAQQRRRTKHTQTFEQCLTEEAEQFRKAADAAPPGMPRELMLKRVRQAEAAISMDRWLKIFKST